MGDYTNELFGATSNPRDFSTELFAPPATRTDRLIKGLQDPIEGGAQLLTNILPQGVVDAGNTFNNWLADKTGLVAKIPDSGMNGLVKQREETYQASRAAAGETGFDGYRLLGNIASPANLAIASKLPAAAATANTLGKMGYGALGGGLSALSSPVTDGDFATEKAKQTAIGLAGGFIIPGVAGGLSSLISPAASTNANLRLLQSEGVRPTIGQTLGGWANKTEEKLQSLPIMGDAIAAARARSTSGFEAATHNRALAPIGLKLPQNLRWTAPERLQWHRP